MESLFVDLLLEAHAKSPKQIILDLEASDDTMDGHREEKFLNRLLQFVLLLPLYVLLRPASAGGQAPGHRHRREHPPGKRIAGIIRRSATWPRQHAACAPITGFTHEALMTRCEMNRVVFVFVPGARCSAINETADRTRQRQGGCAAPSQRPTPRNDYEYERNGSPISS